MLISKLKAKCAKKTLGGLLTKGGLNARPTFLGLREKGKCSSFLFMCCHKFSQKFRPRLRKGWGRCYLTTQEIGDDHGDP